MKVIIVTMPWVVTVYYIWYEGEIGTNIYIYNMYTYTYMYINICIIYTLYHICIIRVFKCSGIYYKVPALPMNWKLQTLGQQLKFFLSVKEARKGKIKNTQLRPI